MPRGPLEDPQRTVALIDETLTCPISYELMTEPVVLNCGHAFEWSAITKYREISHQCPMCRENSDEVTPALALRQVREILHGEQSSPPRFKPKKRQSQSVGWLIIVGLCVMFTFGVIVGENAARTRLSQTQAPAVAKPAAIPPRTRFVTFHRLRYSLEFDIDIGRNSILIESIGIRGETDEIVLWTKRFLMPVWKTPLTSDQPIKPLLYMQGLTVGESECQLSTMLCRDLMYNDCRAVEKKRVSGRCPKAYDYGYLDYYSGRFLSGDGLFIADF